MNPETQQWLEEVRARQTEAEFRYCNKCGWFGYDAEHPKCSYAGVPVQAEKDIRRLLALVAEQAEEVERLQTIIKSVSSCALRLQTQKHFAGLSQ